MDAMQKRGADSGGERGVTTFNRRAIMVSVMVVAVTVMVATFFLSPSARRVQGPLDEISADRVGDASSQQSYLASPPDTVQIRSRQELAARVVDSIGGVLDLSAAVPDQPFDVFAGQVLERNNYQPQAFALPHSSTAPGYAAAVPPAVQGAWQSEAVEAARPAPESLEAQLFHRAMRCGVRECPPHDLDRLPVSSDPTDSDYLTLENLSTRMTRQAAAATPAAGESMVESRPGDRYEEFLRSAGGSTHETVVSSTIQRPVSPYQIMAGTLIPVTLLTAINSDLPGEVIAQVSRNVYDTQQRHLLIPAGARFLGKVDNNVALGQRRVNIGWYRIIYPNNNSVSLPAMAGVDRQGAPGVRDRVNHHTSRNLLNALLLSAIGAGAQLSQPQRGGLLTSPSAGEVAVGGAAQQINQASAEMIRQGMNASPTLHVRQGFNFYVYVSRDLVLEPYAHPPKR